MSGDLKREIMYTVVRSKDLAEFERLVKWYLNSGWGCKGGMVVDRHRFYQPMVKLKKDKTDYVEVESDQYASLCMICGNKNCSRHKRGRGIIQCNNYRQDIDYKLTTARGEAEKE